jgi:threonine dehydrogenase-like Zn-dependent dehydrogenase
MDSLLTKAQKHIPNAIFKCGSVLDKNLYKNGSFDKIYLNGVLTIFDNFEPVFKNLIKWAKKGGNIYVFGMFNPYPIDVLVKHKLSENFSQNIYEKGWNIHSIESIEKFLLNNEHVIDFDFKKFEIQIDLKKNEGDHRRGWTFKDSENQRIITNVLCIIQNQYLLRISL